jgi:hypothetical protein
VINKKKNKPSEANEPISGYQKPGAENTIRFFSSFEEMNEYDHKQMASLTPELRLQNITGMIMEMYKEELSKPMTDLTIYFK